MKNIRWILLLSLGLPLFAQSAGIYKCALGRNISYQNFPCAEGKEIVMSVNTSAPSPVQVVNVPVAPVSAAVAMNVVAAPVSQSPANLPYRATTLQVGMSDDAVLNLPHWGRPDKITRSGTNRRWHEEWTYMHSDGPKRLLFDNARLAAIEDVPEPAQQIVSLSLH